MKMRIRISFAFPLSDLDCGMQDLHQKFTNNTSDVELFFTKTIVLVILVCVCHIDIKIRITNCEDLRIYEDYFRQDGKRSKRQGQAQGLGPRGPG